MKYQEFVSIEMKKRPKDVKVHEYIKVIAKKWHKQKNKKGRGVDKWFKKYVTPVIKTIGKISGITDLIKDHKDAINLIKQAIRTKSVSDSRAAYIQVCKVAAKDALIVYELDNYVTNKLVDEFVPKIAGAVWDATAAAIKEIKGGEVVIGPYTDITKDIPNFYDEIFTEMYIDPTFSGGPWAK